MTFLIKLLIGLFVGNAVTKVVTGKHIHEHVFEWWNSLRDRLVAWAHEHRHLRVVAFIGKIDDVAQGAIARLKVRAKTAKGTTVTVSEERVPLDELLQQQPAFRHSQEAELMEMEA